MQFTRERSKISPEMSSAAIRLLAERGYNATNAEDLADAVGMSRSTFFRRFGSKDDVIFTDHEFAISRLQEFLKTTEQPISEALIRGTIDVLHLLTRDSQSARERSELLRNHPALRDRELVISNRYERIFADFIAEQTSEGTPEWVPVATAAAIVAIHNQVLRHWLRDPDPRVTSTLDHELRELISRFNPWLEPGSGEQRVMVAIYDLPGSPEAVLRAVEESLAGPASHNTRG